MGTDLKEPLKSERGVEGHSKLLDSVSRSVIVSSHVFTYYYSNFFFFFPFRTFLFTLQLNLQGGINV